MKKLFGLLCALSLFLSLPGCGDSGPVNVAEDLGPSEMAEREAMMKEAEEIGNAGIGEGGDPATQ